MACYSLPRVRSYIPLVVSSPIDVEVTTSPCVDWELHNPIVESPASPNEPTQTEATTTTAPPIDGADETEATSPQHDGEYDPEFCGYGVRTSPVSSDANTDSLTEVRVKATASSLPAAGASMGGPRSPIPPIANWSWSSDEDEDDNYRAFLDDCSDAVLQHKILARFNKIATQGAPQMAVDKEANSLSRSTLTILSLTCAYSMCSPP